MPETAFFQEIKDEVSSIFDPSSTVDITRTTTVPNVEDAGFTLASGSNHKAKSLETCVLFIDIRNSTQLNFKHSEQELAKLYSAFITTMLRAAEYYNGYVRNINGDRIMVVFDKEGCFLNALNTATLLSTICNYIIDQHFKNDTFKCGIGIDYGQMLVVKTGTIKKGKENQFYKSFVWLGKPANLASKLTDLANKDNVLMRVTRKLRVLKAQGVPGSMKLGYALSNKQIDVSLSDFADNIVKNSELEPLVYEGKPALFWSKILTNKHAILMTSEVYNGLLAAAPKSTYVTQGQISESSVKVKGYSGKVYGMSTYFPNVKEVK